MEPGNTVCLKRGILRCETLQSGYEQEDLIQVAAAAHPYGDMAGNRIFYPVLRPPGSLYPECYPRSTQIYSSTGYTYQYGRGAYRRPIRRQFSRLFCKCAVQGQIIWVYRPCRSACFSGGDRDRQCYPPAIQHTVRSGPDHKELYGLGSYSHHYATVSPD